MDCKEFEKEIPSFIQHKMDYFSLKDFHAHMQSCSECKEELTIQFLVTDGLKKLEEGDAFDLQKEWKLRTEETTKKIQRGDGVLQMGFWAEIIAVGILAGIILFLLI